jgi:hypothetical protein
MIYDLSTVARSLKVFRKPAEHRVWKSDLTEYLIAESR